LRQNQKCREQRRSLIIAFVDSTRIRDDQERIAICHSY